MNGDGGCCCCCLLLLLPPTHTHANKQASKQTNKTKHTNNRPYRPVRTSVRTHSLELPEFVIVRHTSTTYMTTTYIHMLSEAHGPRTKNANNSCNNNQPTNQPTMVGGQFVRLAVCLSSLRQVREFFFCLSHAQCMPMYACMHVFIMWR